MEKEQLIHSFGSALICGVSFENYSFGTSRFVVLHPTVGMRPQKGTSIRSRGSHLLFSDLNKFSFLHAILSRRES